MKVGAAAIILGLALVLASAAWLDLSAPPALTPSPQPVPQATHATSAGQGARLVIDAVGVDAQLVDVGSTAGDVHVPQDVTTVGWWRHGAALDDVVGASLVVGHVSGNDGTPGALADLADVAVGARVSVTRGGVTREFQVESVTRNRRDALPSRLYDTEQPHRLYIVSCTERVDQAGGGFRYTQNVVITARGAKKTENLPEPHGKKQ